MCGGKIKYVYQVIYAHKNLFTHFETIFELIFCILITQKCSLVNKMNTWYISCHFHRQMDTVCYSKKRETLYTSHFHSQSVFLSVPQLMYHDSSSRYRLLLLLSRDICLNPGPFLNLQPLYHD